MQLLCNCCCVIVPLAVSQDEVNRVCWCAAEWDALERNYSQAWDFARREEEAVQRRTKHIRFLYGVRSSGGSV